jgi:hypothetical protein
MPLYEYVAVEDGEVIELLRPMRDADAPVVDPMGQGRTFKRMLSTFMTGNSAGPRDVALPTKMGGGCACGRPHGPCGS